MTRERGQGTTAGSPSKVHSETKDGDDGEDVEPAKKEAKPPEVTPNMMIDERLAKLEESICACETELDHQQDLLKNSWEDSRTKVEWWRPILP